MASDFTGQELIQAAIYDDVDLLKCLLEGECMSLIDVQDRMGRTPVYTAVSNNSTKCLQVLLDSGADPNIAAGKHFHQMTPLHYALQDEKMTMVKWLLEHGADYNIRDASGSSPIDIAHNFGQEWIDIFENEMERREKIYKDKVREFKHACLDEDVEMMKKVLTECPSNTGNVINTKVTGEGLTPLCWACKCGNMDMVQFLLSNGADPKLPSTDDSYPVHFACRFEQIDCLRLLIEHCPDVVSLRTNTEKLPLHLGVEVQSLNVVKFLMEYKYPESVLVTYRDDEAQVAYKFAFDMNGTNNFGFAAIHMAAERRARDIIEYFVRFSVKSESIAKNRALRSRVNSNLIFSIDSSNSFSASQRDEGSNSKGLYRPVKINITGRNSYTPLHLAVKYKFLDITNILLKNGADVNLLANDGGENKSALMMACENGDVAIMNKLLGHGADDLDKRVFRYAVDRQPKMIPMLLRYRTIKDSSNEYRIDRHAMKQLYLRESEMDDRFDGLNSLNVDFKKKFPVNPVHIKWQDLQHLTSIKEDWLRNVGLHHNKDMQNTYENPYPLFAITKIDVSSNRIGTEFPSVLFRLPSLHCLIISKNHISHFEQEKPSELKCFNLEELVFDTNQIEVLPGYLFTLPSLKKFSAADNSLVEVPEEIWDLPSLAYLNLSNNKLSVLPPPRVVQNSRRMSQQSVSSAGTMDTTLPSIPATPPDQVFSPFDNVPAELEVRRDTIWSNSLEVIENEFDLSSSAYKYRGLQDLNLSHNQLAEIPTWLCCSAPYLESLNLSNNRLKSAGKIFQYPQYLKTLDLSNNKIENTVSWQNLEEKASTCYSRMSRTASSPRLPSLDRMSPKHSYSSLSSVVCSHRQHSFLERLDTLNLSENLAFRKIVLSKEGAVMSGRPLSPSCSTESPSMASLSTKQEEVKRKLIFPNLTSLDLSHNRNLMSIPEDIGEHSSLKRLSLAFTSIRELPPQLGRLKSLFTLETDMCPIEGPIQDIIRGSARRTRDILGFLLSILEESEEYNCMNMMFVGVHDIGKTTLLQQIRKYSKAAKPLTHFSQRIDGAVPGKRQDGGTLSTVGIDINEIVIGEKRPMGPVTFRTWDFGGQKEYYATHQYFLSPRSLYLVMWKLTEGEQGILTIWQWLVNIQARAPGAPVIIIGTHRDILTNRKTRLNYPENFEEDMKKKINEQFIAIEEPEKCGLPNVIGQINVSCIKSGDNIKELVDMIYTKVFDLKHPKRNRERLLQHKIPKKYLILKYVVQELAAERERERKDPVLDRDSYMLKTMNKMLEISGGTALFRDAEDVEQATRFLHENGILFHYEDLALKDLYFLNPQWLCDQLARVVTVDQVNSFPQNGIMKVENLRVLFKRSSFQPENIEQYICGLLGKFEVALQFDRDRLIIPSLLPMEMDMAGCIKRKTDVKIALQRASKEDQSQIGSHLSLYSKRGRSGSGASSVASWESMSSSPGAQKMQLLHTNFTSNVMFSHCRLYVMTYFPSGFWPRLITRILADRSLYDVVMELFPIPQHILDTCSNLRSDTPFWQPWQTGIQLVYHDAILFRIKEVLPGTVGFCDYLHSYMKCFIEDQWMDLDMVNSVIMEMGFQADSIQFTFANYTDASKLFAKSHSEKVILNEKAGAQLLAKITEHIDNLLQDWYPEIGESRFVQNCFGRYLITRIIPCGHCLHQRVKADGKKDKTLSWQFVNKELYLAGTVDIDDDSGLVPPRSHRTVEESTLYCFLVERCILNFLNGHNEICPKHGSVSPTYAVSEEGVARVHYIAPDVVFNDIDSDILLGDSDLLWLEKSIGKGAFGEVHAGKLTKGDGHQRDVAVKILFGPYKEASLSSKGQTHLHMENASVAYLTARQEVSILHTICHDHIVPLLGLSTRPLALVLSLAPLGSLGNRLQQMHSNNRLLSVYTIKQIIIQVAEALSYLHSLSVIYRDLKADNVLIWQMPTSDRTDCNLEPVFVKIADYGISRAILPSGTKGFGGTPPFIAPEILQFAGKTQYTEKVDIFSFGMFMYELITCRKPLEDVTNPTLYICQNGRPSITRKEKIYPSHFLDLMCVSWSHDPSQRPSADDILQIARSPQFCHLADVVSMETSVGILSGCGVPIYGSDLEGSYESDKEDKHLISTEIWLSTSSSNQKSRIEIYSFDKDLQCTMNKTVSMESCEIEGMVYASGCVWCMDNRATVHIFKSSRSSKERQVHLDLKVRIKVLYSTNIWLNGEEWVVFVVKQLAQKKSDSVYLVKISVQGDNIYCTPLLVQGKAACATVVRTINLNSEIESEKRGYELWIGQVGGGIARIDVDFPKMAPKMVTTFSTDSAHTRVCTFLESAHITDSISVWIYNYPGTIVYRFEPQCNEIKEELNCADVVPITESSRISGNTHNDSHRYQVTMMSVLDKYLYVGTTWGCIIVADAHTMLPFNVFRCHSSEDFYVRLILPLHKEESQIENSEKICSVPGILSVGKGYRDLIRTVLRHAEPQVSDSELDVEALMSISNKVQSYKRPVKNPTYILSWVADNWEFY